MNALAVLTELRQAGLEVVPVGDSLRLRGNVAEVPCDLLDRAKQAKPEILGILALRDRLLDLAAVAGISLDLVSELDDADVDACKGENDATLTDYLAALAQRRGMAQGVIPESWTEIVECRGCGPVHLWPGCPPEVIACPWCAIRTRNRTPTPNADPRSAPSPNGDPNAA